MNQLPSDFKGLLAGKNDLRPPHKDYDGPLYWLWVYDPMTADVTITHNEDRPRANAATHDDLAPEVTHPGRINGYAFKIQGGYRICDDEMRKIDDPFVEQQVRKALRQEPPSKPKIHPRYHGMP